MKVEKTYSELMKFAAVAENYLNKQKAKNAAKVEPKETEKENKLVLGIKSFSKQLSKLFEGYNEERDNLQLDNCLVDETTKAILYDTLPNGARNRRFTVAAEKNLKKELKNLGETNVSVDSRIIKGVEDLISELDEEEIEHFSGLVIESQSVLEVVE